MWPVLTHDVLGKYSIIIKQMSWRKLTPWAKGDTLYIYLHLTFPFITPSLVFPVSLHMCCHWHLFTCVPDVQQGDTQTQRGTRKGTNRVRHVCVKSHNCYIFKSLFQPIAHVLLFFMIYVKSLHFGQAHGGLRYSSRTNCSLWLSAHNVILSPTLGV